MPDMSFTQLFTTNYQILLIYVIKLCIVMYEKPKLIKWVLIIMLIIYIFDKIGMKWKKELFIFYSCEA